MRDYYDTEWGFEVRDTPGVYERLVLEGFQAGLSWATVLRKRPAFRVAFAGFVPDAVAAFGDADVARLMADPGIVRNERKIRAAITNARATVALAERGGDLAELFWSFRPEDPTATSEVYPSRSPESEALSRELKRQGFVFVGPVTLYAAMEAMGVLQHRLPT
jgi:DNA-3-methyladenine glycosylase I